VPLGNIGVQRFDAAPKVSVVSTVPTLASLPADAPAGGTAGVSSHADTIHHVHTGAACFADWNDQFVWLKEGYGWQSLC
jgi:hypothetical protein